MIVPIEEYERLQMAELARGAVAALDADDSTWVDADAFGLQLAGERIAAARKAQGLTQKQLGDKLNIPQSQISRIERKCDHTTLRTLKRVAKALNVDIRALI
ncbi:MAG TPA: helix-turn-helix transcriptional regulator [Phycisphaerae bacterium]|nr:helix-turn-helix transcriptional regulator [Phycisphaerae bacterium]